jgi:hypothetical protein
VKTLDVPANADLSAVSIQTTIDALPHEGGRVVLPACDITLDRGLELHSGVELVGQGSATVLRKGPGKQYPLTGYHNYGMMDVPLACAEGLHVGMTVSIHDDMRRGFYETFARIAWIDAGWVGIDTGLAADYGANDNPRLVTAYPMIFGHEVSGVVVRDVILDGMRADQEEDMGACRGGAIYFSRSSAIRVCNVAEHSYAGEGISFQMCRDVVVTDSRFIGNSGNGIHPGAGSTNCLITNCAGSGNDLSGFFFCVRANHIGVTHCEFEGNGQGMSIGTRDCYNVIEDCQFSGNLGPGIFVRPCPEPCEVHSCVIRRCRFEGNALERGRGQIDIGDNAHDILFRGNVFSGVAARPASGVSIAPTAHDICLQENDFEQCDPNVASAGSALSEELALTDCGYDAPSPESFRHLGGTPEAGE